MLQIKIVPIVTTLLFEYEGCKRGQRKGTNQQQQASGEEAAADLEGAADWEEELGAADWEELGAADWEGGGGKRQKRTMMFSGRRVGQL